VALPVSTAVADVAVAVARLRADGAVLCDASAILGDVESLLTSISTLQAIVVRRLRVALEAEATVALTGRSPKRWLIEDMLLGSGEAGRLVRLARKLPFAPTTQQAYDTGEITTGHAAAVLTALDTLPASLRDTVEPHLVERARTHPPEEIAGFTDQLLDGLGLDRLSEVRRERRHAMRGLDLAETLPGTWSVSGTLTGEVGAKLKAALHTAGITGGPGLGDDRTPRQRRHDALGAVVDGYLATSQPSMSGAPRAVMVTMDLATLTAELGQRAATLADGGRVGPETARRLACDAALIPAVLGGRGEILDIGQADHEFPVAIRRAAYLRDGGRCAFPRCRARVAELHHIVFRRHRGPTSLSNAAWLCPFHQYLAHEGGWQLTRASDGNYDWTCPVGLVYTRRLDDG
jgi:hypothetical protein